MIKRWIGLALCLTCTGCKVATVQEPPQKEAPAERSWTEIRDDRVEFVRIHPGAPQKNVYVTWRHMEQKETGNREWRLDGKTPVSAEAVERLMALRSAALAPAIPSDGFYTCRHDDQSPVYTLKFKADGHSVDVVSDSTCQFAAPMNIALDGRAYVQIDGSLGRALKAALDALDTSVSVGSSPGMIVLDAPGTRKNFTATQGDSPRSAFDAQFRADAQFAQVFGHFEAPWTLAGPPAVACNQAKNPDCHDVSAQYTWEASNVRFSLPLKTQDGLVHVSADVPTTEDVRALTAALRTPFPQALTVSPITLTWRAEAQCSMIRGLARHFGAPQTTSCGVWTLTHPDLPDIHYYPGLKSFWIAPGGEHVQTTYQAYCRTRKIGQKQCDAMFKPNRGDGVNYFLPANTKERAYAFVKQGDKTSLERL